MSIPHLLLRTPQQLSNAVHLPLHETGQSGLVERICLELEQFMLPFTLPTADVIHHPNKEPKTTVLSLNVADGIYIYEKVTEGQFAPEAQAFFYQRKRWLYGVLPAKWQPTEYRIQKWLGRINVILC